ncbi:MAG TPA: PPC domain-containing protein, partial [Pirellulaceae bacterium]|nr:PPC domain-containing protein [Pirellulaceae bacterium]
PLVSTAYPLGVQAGVAAKVGFAGPTSEAVPQVDVNAPPTAAGGRISIGGKMAGGASSAVATIAVSRWPEAVEAEPNNEPAKATPMTAPGGANGRFDAPRDRDYFSFDAKKGQRFAFRAGSRSFGSPALVKMFIQKADGAALAESAVSDQDEETLVFAVPEDGSYRLAVEDLLKRGGPDFVYRVSVEPAPTFTLSLKADKATRHKFVVAKNGALGIDVQCARSGYDGPVTLSVDGPGGAYQVFNNVIPDKGAAIKLLVIPPAGFNPGQFAALKIVGKATVNNEEITSTTGTADLMRVLRPAIAYPPSWLDGVVSVSGAPDQAPFYTATLDRPAVLVPRHSGQSEFNVKLERANDAFKDPLTVLVIGGPPGVTYEVKRNGNGKQETYQVLVKGTPNMPESSTPVKVVSFGELAGKGLAVVSADLPIQVVTPLSVSVSPAGGLVFGNKQKLKLTVTRLASAEKQPVVVKWKKLPPGVTGPAEVTIPADQTAAEVELVAAADAPAGAINDLTVTATTKFQGADVTVDSGPLAAEVKK